MQKSSTPGPESGLYYTRTMDFTTYYYINTFFVTRKISPGEIHTNYYSRPSSPSLRYEFLAFDKTLRNAIMYRNISALTTTYYLRAYYNGYEWRTTFAGDTSQRDARARTRFYLVKLAGENKKKKLIINPVSYRACMLIISRNRAVKIEIKKKKKSTRMLYVYIYFFKRNFGK